jgi:hypothetical protein
VVAQRFVCHRLHQSVQKLVGFDGCAEDAVDFERGQAATCHAIYPELALQETAISELPALRVRLGRLTVRLMSPAPSFVTCTQRRAPSGCGGRKWTATWRCFTLAM